VGVNKPSKSAHLCLLTVDFLTLFWMSSHCVGYCLSSLCRLISEVRCVVDIVESWETELCVILSFIHSLHSVLLITSRDTMKRRTRFYVWVNITSASWSGSEFGLETAYLSLSLSLSLFPLGKFHLVPQIRPWSLNSINLSLYCVRQTVLFA